MKSVDFVKFQTYLREYTPKSVSCFRFDYFRKYFATDLFAGISVGVIALPLALALAIASGVAPEKGLFTAIIAGFLISLLGGSRVQIGGPTGAFVVLVYAIVQRQGYEGLAIATLMAGVIMILMGFARLGVLLKFIPFSVTRGFTTGIALVIFTSQIKDFLGLQLVHQPPEFVEKCKLICLNLYSWNPWAASIAIISLILIFALQHYNSKIPAALLVISFATVVVHFFDLPLDTIASKFGELPGSLPAPSLPNISYARIRELFPDAFSIAMLAAIESLLSALIADGMTGHRHRSNCELVAQGFANIGSVLFGGIPATGAIARTGANIRLGAKTPVAGMVHAITMLLLMVLLAPLAGMIPLCTLSAVLMYVVWHMSEVPQFIHILKSSREDAFILLVSFFLTILIDITAAVQVGVLLSGMLFLKKMTDTTVVRICTVLMEENAKEGSEARDNEILFRKDVPSEVVVFEIKGPFFYSVTGLLDEVLLQVESSKKVFILWMRYVPLIDTAGVQALQKFADQCRNKDILLLVSGVNGELKKAFKKSHLTKYIGSEHIFTHIDDALAYAKKSPLCQDLAKNLQGSTLVPGASR